MKVRKCFSTSCDSVPSELFWKVPEQSGEFHIMDKTLELLVQPCLQLELCCAMIAGIIRIRNNHTTDSCNSNLCSIW